MLQRDASQEEEVSYSDETEEEDEEEEEEEETISRLSEVSVRDKVPPGYPPLTKHQLLRHRDALNVRLLCPRCLAANSLAEDLMFKAAGEICPSPVL